MSLITQENLVTANPEDPNRCTGVTHTGNQCKYLAEAGGRCRLHAYGLALRKNEPSNYEIAHEEFRKRFERTRALAPKTCRDEEGILTVMLETVLGDVLKEDSLISRSGEIINLIASIRELKKTNFAIEKDLGDLMTKEQAMEFALKLLDTVMEEVAQFNMAYEEKHGEAPDFYPILEKLADKLGGEVGGEISG